MRRTITGRFTAMAATLALAVGILTGCSTHPKPSVDDLDSYQVVTLGPVRYVTPEGVAVKDQGNGYVVHELKDLPDVTLRVEVDLSPPRQFTIDADAEKRKFLDEVPNSRARSAQYSDVKGRQRLKVLVRGSDKDQALAGAVMVVREGARTAVVKAFGPFEHRVEINRAVEDIAARVELTGK